MVGVLASQARNALSTAELISHQSFEFTVTSVSKAGEVVILSEGSNRWKVLKQGENLTAS